MNVASIVDAVGKGAKGAIAFSKKNLPTIMIGGAIVGFWSAAWLIVKKAPEARDEILQEEKAREEAGKDPLSKKDKAFIYGKHLWAPGAIGVLSTGLAIGADKINLSRIGEMYLLSQFYKEDGEKLKKQILKQDGGEKQLDKMRKASHREEFPAEEQDKWVPIAPGEEGSTLIIDVVTGSRWRDNIVNVLNGINEYNEHMKELWSKKNGDPFFSSSASPHEMDFYVSEGVSVFLEMIGEPNNWSVQRGIAELLEFRYYGEGSGPIKAKNILDYEKYMDPSSNNPVICYLDYFDLIAPSGELAERFPN